GHGRQVIQGRNGASFSISNRLHLARRVCTVSCLEHAGSTWTTLASDRDCFRRDLTRRWRQYVEVACPIREPGRSRSATSRIVNATPVLAIPTLVVHLFASMACDRPR